MELSLKHKVLWQFLCDNCDCAGVWEPNWKLASVMIGEKMKAEDLRVFGERLMLFGSGKVLIVGFVMFQYGKLSTECRPHQNIFKAIEKHGIAHLVEGHPDFSDRVSNRVSGRVSDTLQDKEEDKEEEEERDDEVQEKKGGDLTTAIYAAYPRKVARPPAIRAIAKALASPPLGVGLSEWPGDLLAITERYAALRKTEPIEFTPHPATWFNERRFEDDPSTWVTAASGSAKPAAAPVPTFNRWENKG